MSEVTRGLDSIVDAMSRALKLADADRPAATGRSGRQWRHGIGPHSESETFSLMIAKLAYVDPDLASDVRTEVPFPNFPRQRCDIVVGQSEQAEWAIEAKLLRFLGDNGKPNDNMLMHIISPYDEDRSALTDCTKLRTGGLGDRHAVLILGYESTERPLEPALRAFERLASDRCTLGSRVVRESTQLVHPVHDHAKLVGWEVLG